MESVPNQASGCRPGDHGPRRLARRTRGRHNVPMICANCGADRSGPFCGQCGQNDRDYQRALPPLLGDLLREAFEVDSRLLRTLKKLLFQPGELAAEFSRNRRASYVSPIRLYLFASLAFFFLLSVTADFQTGPEVRPAMVQGEKAAADTDTARLQSLLSAERRQKVVEILGRPETSIARLLLLQLAGEYPEDARELDAVDVYILNQLIDALYEPSTVVAQLMDNLPIAMFVMLPIYALLLKIFYFGKHRYYVENLVFAAHLHTFAFLVFTVELLLPGSIAIGWLDSLVEAVASILMLALAFYHFVALKHYFQDGTGITLLKFVGLMTVYLAMLLPGAFVTVLVVTVFTV
jgi:hypothetical protein